MSKFKKFDQARFDALVEKMPWSLKMYVCLNLKHQHGLNYSADCDMNKVSQYLANRFGYTKQEERAVWSKVYSKIYHTF